MFCRRQNIPLRGHREGCSTINPGNFKVLLKFRVDSGDKLLEDHLETGPWNASYTSKTIQNEIISIIGETIQNKILNEVCEGGKVFSVIADEARDISNKEQMPLIIRYVDKHYKIHGKFIAFLECGSTRGEDIAKLIETKCLELQLDMNMCRGQGYDGAGNMAGYCNRAAKVISTKFPKAVYFHCSSHKLNLCVANSCKLRSIENMMGIITTLAIFLKLFTETTKVYERTC